jgi:hypothetical protein
VCEQSSAWWAEKRPASARWSAGSFARRRPRASSAGTLGSPSPATSASIIARPEDAEHVRGDAGELDPSVLEHLVEPVRLPLPLLDQRLAVAGQVAELADRLGRHEAGSQQPVLEQLAQPVRIGHIGLAPRHVLDLAGVAEQQLEVASSKYQTGFQQTPVASIATCVTPRPRSQSRSASRSAVIVVKLSISSPRPPCRFGTRTHAVTLPSCTSSPHQRSSTRSIANLLASLADATAGRSPRQSRVWSTCSRHGSESRRAPGATLSSDSPLPRSAGLNAAADPISIRRGWPATRPSSLSPRRVQSGWVSTGCGGASSACASRSGRRLLWDPCPCLSALLRLEETQLAGSDGPKTACRIQSLSVTSAIFCQEERCLSPSSADRMLRLFRPPSAPPVQGWRHRRVVQIPVAVLCEYESVIAELSVREYSAL